MKKLFKVACILLSVFLLIPLTGCNEKTPSASPSAENGTTDKPTSTIKTSPTPAPTLAPETNLTQYKKFLDKAARGEDIVIAYLGGSITQGAATSPTSGTGVDGQHYSFSYDSETQSYRALTFNWLQEHYAVRPNQFKQVNAAIGGTPSFLGAYRLPANVLTQKPDFLFVEFAINDNASPAISDKTPYTMFSIYETLQSIVEQTYAVCPDCAIFMPVSAYRKLGGTQQAWEDILKQGLRVTRNYANFAHIPYANCADLFYNDPSVDKNKVFMGDSGAGNTVHPSPYGHSVYAAGIEKAIENIFTNASFDFKPADFTNATKVEMDKLKGMPYRATLVMANDLTFEGATLSSTVYTDFRKDYKKLVSKDAAKTFSFTFKGSAVGMWCDSGTNGYFNVKVDGISVGKWGLNVKRTNTSNFFGFMFFIAKSGLDPAKTHTIELVPDADQSDITNGGKYALEILAVMVDEYSK